MEPATLTSGDRIPVIVRYAQPRQSGGSLELNVQRSEDPVNMRTPHGLPQVR